MKGGREREREDALVRKPQPSECASAVCSAFKCSTVVPPGVLPDQTEPIRSFTGITGVYLRRHFLLEFGPMILYYFATFSFKGPYEGGGGGN